MGAGLKAPDIGKIEILRDQKSLLGLRRCPDSGAGVFRQIFIGHGVDIVPELPDRDGKLLGHIFVELQVLRNAQWEVNVERCAPSPALHDRYLAEVLVEAAVVRTTGPRSPETVAPRYRVGTVT